MISRATARSFGIIDQWTIHWILGILSSTLEFVSVRALIWPVKGGPFDRISAWTEARVLQIMESRIALLRRTETVQVQTWN